jgi:hypothetical protein
LGPAKRESGEIRWRQRMIPKSVKRFSDQIMRKQHESIPELPPQL